MSLSRAITCASILLFASIPSLAAGNGLKGEYFNNTGLVGTPAVTRTDTTVNFEWWGTPAAGISNNYFSARWSGKVEAPVSGAYKLATISNEAVRVWLDGTLIIDNWADHWTARNTSAAINLAAGQQYSLRIDYREGLGMAVAKLLWSYPGQTETVIPQARLYSDTVTPAAEPVYLSELTPVLAQNGWGQYERDRSNGESRYRDGSTIEINDKKWGRGLGVHAASDLRYQLMGRYKSFLTDIGIDDEVGARGSVVFEVWLDGTKKFTSPVMKGTDPVASVALDVTGVNELKLIVLDGGDGIAYDHADWAGARVWTGSLPTTPSPNPSPNPTPTPQPAAPTGLSATPGSGFVQLSWNEVTGAGSYVVYRGTTSGSASPFATGVLLTNFKDLNTNNGTMYYYRVAAVVGSVLGQQSSQVNATPQATPTPVQPPAVPTGLAATAGNAQVSLQWTGVSGATGYNLFRSTSSSLQGDQIATGLTSASFVNLNLTNGTTYFYRVAATNSGGSSLPSAPVSATPVAPPAPPPPPSVPTGLAATAGNAQVSLVWGGVTGATGYTVYRTTTAGAQGDPIMTGLASPSFINTGLTNGTTYYYRVAASNANGSSAPSTQVSAKPLAPPVPAAPTGLAATAGNAEITLNWMGNDASTSYNVYRSTTSGGQGSTPIIMGITTPTFKDTGLTNGTTYYYKVAGVNANGTGAMSNQASGKPVAPPAPPAPTGLAATAGDTTVTLNWTASEGAATYNVYRGTASGAQGAMPIMSGITELTFKDTGLVNNTIYYYKVAAVNTNGTSAMSNQASAKPVPPPPPGAPTGFSASAGNALVTLNWTAVTGALSYNIYRGTSSGGQGTAVYGTSAGPTFADTAVTNGTAYYYKVAAVSASGVGTKSAEASAVPTPPVTVLTPEQMSAFKFLRQSTWGPTPAQESRRSLMSSSLCLRRPIRRPWWTCRTWNWSASSSSRTPCKVRISCASAWRGLSARSGSPPRSKSTIRTRWCLTSGSSKKTRSAMSETSSRRSR